MTCCEHCYSDEADCTNQCPCHHVPHQNDYSQRDHAHCWESAQPPCGQKIEHLKCCLCELPNPKVPHQNEAEWVALETYFHTYKNGNTRIVPERLRAFLRANFVPRTQIAEVVASKDNAYHERDMLVCALTKVFPAYLARHSDEDKEWEDDWRWIVYIELPTGQVSWHIHDKERAMFDHLEVGPNEWDGHNTERKYQRLAALEALKAKLTNPK